MANMTDRIETVSAQGRPVEVHVPCVLRVAALCEAANHRSIIEAQTAVRVFWTMGCTVMVVYEHSYEGCPFLPHSHKAKWSLGQEKPPCGCHIDPMICVAFGRGNQGDFQRAMVDALEECQVWQDEIWEIEVPTWNDQLLRFGVQPPVQPIPRTGVWKNNVRIIHPPLQIRDTIYDTPWTYDRHMINLAQPADDPALGTPAAGRESERPNLDKSRSVRQSIHGGRNSSKTGSNKCSKDVPGLHLRCQSDH